MNNLEEATKSAGLETQYLEFAQGNRTDLQGNEGVSVYFQLFQTPAFNASSSEYSNADINNTLPNGDVFLTTNSTNATNFSTGYTVTQTVILALLAGSTSLITIAGNLVVILSFILERTIRQPANYFIASLAVSDLLIGSVSMPFYTVYLLAGQYWPLGANLCDLWLSIDYTVCLCSIYTVFCITVDRFCSVKIPAKYRNWRTDRKVLLMICVTWTVPVIVFFTSIFGWQYFVGERTVAEGKCYVQYMESPVFNALLQVGYFWITLTIMCSLYTGIYKVALRLQTRSEEKYRKMASLVSVAGQAMSKIGIGMSQQDEQIQRQPAQVIKGTPQKGCYAVGEGNICGQLTIGQSGPPDRKGSRSVCPPMAQIRTIHPTRTIVPHQNIDVTRRSGRKKFEVRAVPTEKMLFRCPIRNCVASPELLHHRRWTAPLDAFVMDWRMINTEKWTGNRLKHRKGRDVIRTDSAKVKRLKQCWVQLRLCRPEISNWGKLNVNRATRIWVVCWQMERREEEREEEGGRRMQQLWSGRCLGSSKEGLSSDEDLRFGWLIIARLGQAIITEKKE